MKNHNVLLLILLFLLQSSTLPQIPNGGLEEWSGGNPDSWTTNNIIGFLEPVTMSNDAHSGDCSAKLEMMTAMNSLFQPVLTAGEPGVGIPVSLRHSKINFYYKYYPTTASVSLVLSVGMYRNGAFIGVAVGTTKTGSSTFKKMTANINYFGQEVPDHATIYVTLIDSLFNPSSTGSYAIVDDFYFDQIIEVKNEKTPKYDFSVKQNYPNPFNPVTTIRWQSPESGWQIIKVYNILSREIATLVNEYRPAGDYSVQFNGAGLPSGIYLYKVQSGNNYEVKRMVLLK
jgi:hypothetical protein